MDTSNKPLVAVIMGSRSDWDIVSQAVQTLSQFSIGCECRVLSAHRTPHQAAEYCAAAESRGIEVIIAAAGGAAHLAGAAAAHSLLPVIGIPIEGPSLGGLDSLMSTAQMPAGVPVATMAIGRAGAVNAGLYAAAILAASRPELREHLREYRRKQAEKVLAVTLP